MSSLLTVIVGYRVTSADGHVALIIERVRAEQWAVQCRGTVEPLMVAPRSDARPALLIGNPPSPCS
jgi:hypothetical protein